VTSTKALVCFSIQCHYRLGRLRILNRLWCFKGTAEIARAMEIVRGWRSFRRVGVIKIALFIGNLQYFC
jgi:hypothetical protein